MFVCLLLVLNLAVQPANAQLITESTAIFFGNLIIPSGGGVVKIEPDNTVSLGADKVLAPPSPNRGVYRLFGVGGTVDISVDTITTCDAAVTLDTFTAIWRGTTYASINSSAIIGAAFDGDDDLSLGARISYGGSTPLGACPSSFNLNVTFY